MESNLPRIESGAEGWRAGLTRSALARWGAVLAWMGLIYWFSAQSSFALLDHVWQPSLLSIAAHFTEYAVLAALLWLALRKTPALARLATPVAFGLAVLYALSDEWHQSFVPGRYPDGRDVLVDALGAAVALWLVRRASLAQTRGRG
jgi:VanZ family protein